MAGQGMKNYNWCAKDGNVWYKDCERCRLHYYGDCDFRFKTHPDAVQKADMIRIGKGAPLFSKDFDAMKKSLQQGETTKKANLYGRSVVKCHLQPKQETKKAENNNESNLGTLVYCFFAAFVSSLILAFILQFCAIMTDWLFGIISVFIGLDNGSSWAKTAEESFFYATYGQAYIYALVLQHLIIVWMFNEPHNRWTNILKWIVSAYFAIASIAMPQLFLSMAIGPIFIYFCFAITSKK